MRIMSLTCLLMSLIIGFGSAVHGEDLAQVLNKLRDYQDSSKVDSFLQVSQILLDSVRQNPELSDTVAADIYNNVGRSYFLIGDFTACDSLWTLAQKHAMSAGLSQDTVMASILKNFGRSCHQTWHYHDAQKYYQRSLDIQRRIYADDHPEVIKTRMGLAMLLSRQSQFEKAMAIYQETLPLLIRAYGPDHLLIANNLNQQSMVLFELGRFKEADSLTRRALAIREKNLPPGHPDIGKLYINLGNLEVELREYTSAEYHLKRALEIMANNYGQEDRYVGICKNNLANLYIMEGNYSDALPMTRDAMEIQKKIGGAQSPSVAVMMTNAARLLVKQGNYAKAKEVYLEIRDIAEREFGYWYSKNISTYSQLAFISEKLGKFEESEQYLSNALKICDSLLGRDHYKYAQVVAQRGMLRIEAKHFGSADSLLHEALNILDNTVGLKHPLAGQIHMALGDMAIARKNYYDALQNYIYAENIFTIGQNDYCPDLIESRIDIGRTYLIMEDYQRCLKYFQKALHWRLEFMNYMFSSSSEEQKLRWLSKYPLIIHDILKAALKINNRKSAELALEMVINGKASVMDASSAMQETAYCTIDESLHGMLVRKKDISTEISNLMMNTITGEKYKNVRDGLNLLMAVYDSLDAEISLQCVAMTNQKLFKIVTVADIIDALPEKSEMWEYIRYYPPTEDNRNDEPHYLGFCVEKSGAITLVDLGPASPIDSLVQFARGEIAAAAPHLYTDMLELDEAKLKPVLHHLFEKIFAPLANLSGNNNDIYISPDGLLNLLPFEILVDNDSSYAINHYNISYLSSGRDLTKVFTGGRSGKKYLAIFADPDFDARISAPDIATDTKDAVNPMTFQLTQPLRSGGDCLDGTFSPLQYGRRECEAIEEAVSPDSQYEIIKYLGKSAGEYNFKDMQESPWILHIATHGFFCSDNNSQMLENPLLKSGIVLSGANRRFHDRENNNNGEEDGILTSFEISGCNLLATDLVVLSACETGVGEIVDGEGVFGLRRAFRNAGARTLIMSLWQVPDRETANLMADFYKRLISGGSKRDALRLASLSIMKYCRHKYNCTHPLYWGGFVLEGNPQ